MSPGNEVDKVDANQVNQIVRSIENKRPQLIGLLFSFVMLLLTNPELGVRFSQVILRAMQALARLLDEEAGYTPETAPRDFGFADDNCVLLNPELYEMFARVWREFYTHLAGAEVVESLQPDQSDPHMDARRRKVGL